MAFDLAGLHQVGPSGDGPRIWTYSTVDPIATVNTAGYFDNGATTNTGMRNVLQVRDIIFVCDTNVPTTNIVSVLTIASGVIDVSNGTAIAETDSD